MSNHLVSSRGDERNEPIQQPEEVQLMLALAERGWGSKRIAKELGCSRNTVRRYLKLGGWQDYAAPGRTKKLDQLGDWLASEFRRHGGNADVIRQELKRVHEIDVSLRTVERAVEQLRQEVKVQAIATVRFETGPGHQLQIDFGQRGIKLAGQLTKVFLFVATLGYSRRIYAEAFFSEKQSSWFSGLENAFQHFGGTTKEVLIDNAGPLVHIHDRQTREVVFNERFAAFCKYWKVRPKACAPYRARTKGKDERGVGYVKGNAVAGREFQSLEELNAHLLWWAREIADQRVHGTTGEVPQARYQEGEAKALRPLTGLPSFLQFREVGRQVANDAYVDLDTNRYSVPWKLVGEHVTVTATSDAVTIHHKGQLVASHTPSTGRHQRVTEPSHLEGIYQRTSSWLEPEPVRAELLRPLDVYEAAAGGKF